MVSLWGSKQGTAWPPPSLPPSFTHLMLTRFRLNHKYDPWANWTKMSEHTETEKKVFPNSRLMILPKYRGKEIAIHDSRFWGVCPTLHDSAAWLNIRFRVWKYEPSRYLLAWLHWRPCVYGRHLWHTLHCTALHNYSTGVVAPCTLTQKISYFYGHRNAIKCACPPLSLSLSLSLSLFLPLPYQFPLRSIFHRRG